MASLSPDLLSLLICPACHSDVALDGNALQCTKRSCRRRYAVNDGIPVMLISESKVADEADFDQAIARTGKKAS